MSQFDDPPDKKGKTIIRPRPGEGQPFGASRQFPDAGRPPDRTVIAPQSPGGQAPPGVGWPPPGAGVPQPDWMSDDFGARPPVQPVSAPRQRIPLSVALGGRHEEEVPASNPITQAAVPLLILLGRLRQMVVEMDAVPLMQHVARSISEVEKKLHSASVPEEQVQIAKYALCATADDIVQNLPGTDKHIWMQYSMLAQFFGVRTSGIGFFDKIRQLTSNPTVYYNLLELLHACLSLGFEGQYRGAGGGDIELQRVRRDVYTTLRTVKPREADDISPRWRGLEIKTRGLGTGIPVWAIGAFLLAALSVLFLMLRFNLSSDADAVAQALVRLHPPGGVQIERKTFAPMTPAESPVSTTQLERIRAALAPEIGKGLIAVDAVGDFIVARINNLLLFDSGSADVKADFKPLGQRIATALNKEPGNINIVGHTDNVKLKLSNRFKSNFDLSVKRAEGVAAVLSPLLDNPSRLAVAGKGEDEPIESNDTPEGRAKNRRVEISIPREETLH
jgi:type VI secretion system protein ImpK